MSATSNNLLAMPAEALSAPCSKGFKPMLKGDKSDSNVDDWTASICGTLVDFGIWDKNNSCPNYSVMGMWSFLKGTVDEEKCSYYLELLKTEGAENFWLLVQKRYCSEVTIAHQALVLESVNTFQFGNLKDYVADVQHLEALAANLKVAFGGKPIEPMQLVLLCCLFCMHKEDHKEVEREFTAVGGIEKINFGTIADVLARQQLNDEAESAQGGGAAK